VVTCEPGATPERGGCVRRERAPFVRGDAGVAIEDATLSACSGDENTLEVTGSPGAYVAEGARSIHGGAGWSVDVKRTRDGYPSNVEIEIGDSWSVALSTDSLGKPLGAGTYLDAQRADFADPGRPGLDISGDGRGCNEVSGRFEVLDVALLRGAGPARVLELRALFEERCDGHAAFRGCVQFREP
jgi:hypothetical protein